MSQIVIKRDELLQEIIAKLDLPPTVEEKVRDRYDSLGNWFNREKCSLKNVDIFVQGSFGQGTTIKPLNEEDDYDLDMSCKVNIVDFKLKYSQEDLMQMVKHELELYRKSVSIQAKVEEKRRCLRLYYKDEVSFHLDFVPSIPLEESNVNKYHDRLLKFYEKDDDLSLELAQLAVNIPDKESHNYQFVDDNWHIRNQRGYLLWFQNRMILNDRKVIRASIEPIPNYYKKTVLQRCIQLFKRHRDTMFSDEEMKDSKPISIIISTLAARAYEGEQDLTEAIINILERMPNYINNYIPRIPNPVKPEEDFTDRWDTQEGKELNETASTILKLNLSIKMDENYLIESFNFVSTKNNAVTNLPKEPPKLWGDEY